MSNFSFQELKEGEDFNPLALCSDTPFTQATFYGQWQKALGREVRRFVVSKSGKPVVFFQLIKYPLIAGKNYAYCPFGPVVKEYSPELLVTLKTELSKLAKSLNAVFIRLDFIPVPQKNLNLQKYFTKSLAATYHSAYFQPRVEWFLSLEPGKEELYQRMNNKHRYSIRLAERKGIVPEIITTDFEKHFARFYELMIETAKRDGFSLHPRAYYENVFKNLQNIPGSFLALAKYQNKILVADVIVVYGSTANYVYGSSSDELRTFGTSFTAQWAALQQAKKISCARYNFGGIAVPGVYSDWEGLTRFKKRFGGYEVHHSDFYDLVANPFWYWLYNLRKLLKKI